MSNNKTIEEKIRSMFTRAKNKGYANNFSFCDDFYRPPQDLPPQEHCIVEINARDGSKYLVTNLRIIHTNDERLSVPFSDISGAYWMSRGPNQIDKSSPHRDRVVVDTNNGQETILDNLGGSYYPLLDSIGWIVSAR